ncbi:hypothetical protein GCM10025881_39630 [Pseudolysinimonas kribbensis]|uniref:Uncharacterized protein n=1 Tax=Pseudolysinimonas kribbensis TaxID=433641 RepID=A0ABQ6K9Y1_9MICO|nr:hypothetical protein GCM10025881_00550 [Pseudolysinimonas kribbensis]GMA97139.1 hypothetical protein GCM10025881_39630 [Pseudolysinimonas kribbensis]
MQPRSRGTEPREHIVGAELGELAERADAEPGEQRDELRAVELRAKAISGLRRDPSAEGRPGPRILVDERDRERSEEGGGGAGGDDRGGVGAALRGALRGEQPVGDADPRTRRAELARDAEHVHGRRLLAAVVPRGPPRPHGDRAGTQRMQPRQRLLERDEQRLERTRVERGVVTQHVQPG